MKQSKCPHCGLEMAIPEHMDSRVIDSWMIVHVLSCKHSSYKTCYDELLYYPNCPRCRGKQITFSEVNYREVDDYDFAKGKCRLCGFRWTWEQKYEREQVRI